MKKVLNFIGSKLSVLEFIYNTIIRTIDGKLENHSFLDIMAGTTVVAQRMYECNGVIANDIELFSYVLANNYIGLSLDADTQQECVDIINQLNNLKPLRGYITNTYSPLGGKMYYTEHNAMKLDAACVYARRYEGHRLYYFVVASILESADRVANVACNYESYLKQFKSSAVKPIEFLPALPLSHVTNGKVYRLDALELTKFVSADIVYIDPPYNRRQYGSMYRVLNTIAKCCSTRYQDYSSDNYIRSQLCYKSNAARYLNELLKRLKCRYVFMSYNDEGILSLNEIKKMFSKHGVYDRYTYVKRRFNSHSDKRTSSVAEYLHVLIK